MSAQDNTSTTEALAVPRRRIRFQLDLGADDWPEVVRVLEDLALGIERGQPPIDQSSGGWSSGHHCWSSENPEQTGDSYRAELETWIAARRAAPTSPIVADLGQVTP